MEERPARERRKDCEAMKENPRLRPDYIDFFTCRSRVIGALTDYAEALRSLAKSGDEEREAMADIALRRIREAAEETRCPDATTALLTARRFIGLALNYGAVVGFDLKNAAMLACAAVDSDMRDAWDVWEELPDGD